MAQDKVNATDMRRRASSFLVIYVAFLTHFTPFYIYSKVNLEHHADISQSLKGRWIVRIGRNRLFLKRNSEGLKIFSYQDSNSHHEPDISVC